MRRALAPTRRSSRCAACTGRGTHLLGLINQVLDLSKIEAGKLELNLEKIAVAPLVDEVVGTARTLAEQNKNRLSVECPADLPPIEGRRHEAPADSSQSAEQRLQVHQGRRDRTAGGSLIAQTDKKASSFSVTDTPVSA